MLSGLKSWRSAIRNLLAFPQRNRGRRPRLRRDFFAGPEFALAAEVMEARALLSGPAMGPAAFTSLFQNSGTATGGAEVNGKTLTTDAAGNVYASVLYSGTGDINPLGTAYAVSNTNPQTDVPGGYGLNLLAKYGPDLVLQWAVVPPVTPTGTSAATNGFGKVSVGAVSGDVYVSGTIGNGSETLTTVGGTTLTISNMEFVARLDHSTGNVVWLAETAGVGGSMCTVATDRAENVYLLGTGSITCTPVYGIANAGVPISITGATGQPYLAKLNSTGTALWSGQFGSGFQDGPGGAPGPYMDVDAAGNIYFLGTINTTTDVNPSSAVTTVKPKGARDSLIEKIDTNGNLVWYVDFGAKFVNDGATSIRVDSSGNVDASANSTSAFGYSTPGSNYGKQSGNLVQLSNNGTVKWLVTAGTYWWNNWPGTLSLDPAGNMYFKDGGTTLDKYNSSGSQVWSVDLTSTPFVYTNSYNNEMSDPAVDSTGNLWWTAGFYSSTGTINVSPPGSAPVYLAATTDTNSAALGIVEWTQPGGFAAAGVQGAATPALSPSPITTPSPSTGQTPSQPVLIIGATPPPAFVPQSDPAPLEWWIGETLLGLAS